MKIIASKVATPAASVTSTSITITRIMDPLKQLINISAMQKIIVAFLLVITLLAEINLFLRDGESSCSFPIVVLLGFQLIAAVIDFKKRIIPLWIIFSALIFGTILFCFFDTAIPMKTHIIGGILGFIVIAVLILLSRGQIGTGDLLLFSVTGFYTGSASILAVIFLSVFLSGIFSIFLLVLKKGSRSSEIPFAPFILSATVILSSVI